MQIIVIADDLSGAAETVSALAANQTKIWLYSKAPKTLLNEINSLPVVAIDGDLRQLSKIKAKLRCIEITQVLANSTQPKVVFHKADSLMRGHLDVVAAEALKAGPVVLALANPSTGRTTLGGVVFVHGQPLHETDHHKHEPSEAPLSIVHALGAVAGDVVDLTTVRSGATVLEAKLTDLAELGKVAICDAETEADLQAIAGAALRVGRGQATGTQLIGSAGLAKALAEVLQVKPQVRGVATANRANEILVVVGSGAEASVKQAAAIDPARATVVNVAETRKLSTHTAELAARAWLVLTGGETARRVLDALGTEWIQPITEIENGVTVSQTSRGQLAIIKPGSYGTQDTLVNAVEYLRALQTKEKSST